MQPQHYISLRLGVRNDFLLWFRDFPVREKLSRYMAKRKRSKNQEKGLISLLS